MTAHPRITTAVLAGALLAILAGPSIATAQSDPLKCQRAVVRETTKFFKGKVKALQKCEDAKAKGSHTDPCPCPACPAGSPGKKAQEKTDKAESKLRAGIDKRCGGANRLCEVAGDDNLDYETLFGMTACPNFESGSCTQPILANDCTGLRECMVCIGEAVVDQLVSFLYADLDAAKFGAGTSPDKEINKCQIAVGKELAKFVLAKEKTVGKCWDARYKGKHTADCPDSLASPVTAKDAVKAAAKIAKSESKKIVKLCKACGGADKDCDDPVMAMNPLTPTTLGNSSGGDDLLLSDVFATVPLCPVVVAPARADRPAVDCAQKNPLATLADLVFCLDCLAEFKVDCADAARVTNGFGTFATVAPECNPGPPPCPTRLQLDGSEATTDADLGGAGFWRDENGPVLERMTFVVTGCAGASSPCGQCDLSGPVANAGGAGFDYRRCSGDASITCTADSDCGGAAPCRFFLGPPTPQNYGGIAACITSEVAGGITGTTNLDTGATEMSLPIALGIEFGLPVEDPCPLCLGDVTANDGGQDGTCVGGSNNGGACDVHGTSSTFADDVSLDCPPGLTFDLPEVDLPLSTHSTSLALSPASPTCRAAGYTTFRCACDTCQTAAAEPCRADVDCPASRTCGGLRCLAAAPNIGDPCTAASDCGGFPCGVDGPTPTAINSCHDATCTPTNAHEGTCLAGPFDGFCSPTEIYRGCLLPSDCPFPGDTCMVAARPCFLTNGDDTPECVGGGNSGTPSPGGTGAGELCSTLADCPDQSAGTACQGVIEAAGTASTSSPTLAGVFCVGTTNTGFIDVSGFPGPARVTLPVTATTY